MPTKTNSQHDSHALITQMKTEYTAAGWKVVNEEVGAIAFSKPAHYVGPASDKGKASVRRPRTLFNWIFGRA